MPVKVGPSGAFRSSPGRYRGRGGELFLVERGSVANGDPHDGARGAIAVVLAQNRIATVVFPSLAGTLRDPIDAESVSRRNRDRLSFSSSTSHPLRKTTATALDLAGMSARAIAEYLGHSKPSLTRDVYMSRNVGSTAAADHLDRMSGSTPALNP